MERRPRLCSGGSPGSEDNGLIQLAPRRAPVPMGWSGAANLTMACRAIQLPKGSSLACIPGAPRNRARAEVSAQLRPSGLWADSATVQHVSTCGRRRLIASSAVLSGSTACIPDQARPGSLLHGGALPAHLLGAGPPTHVAAHHESFAACLEAPQPPVAVAVALVVDHCRWDHFPPPRPDPPTAAWKPEATASRSPADPARQHGCPPCRAAGTPQAVVVVRND